MFHYYNAKRQFSYLIAFHSYFFRYKLLRVETMESTRLGCLSMLHTNLLFSLVNDF